MFKLWIFKRNFVKYKTFIDTFAIFLCVHGFFVFWFMRLFVYVSDVLFVSMSIFLLLLNGQFILVYSLFRHRVRSHPKRIHPAKRNFLFSVNLHRDIWLFFITGKSYNSYACMCINIYFYAILFPIEACMSLYLSLNVGDDAIAKKARGGP